MNTESERIDKPEHNAEKEHSKLCNECFTIYNKESVLYYTIMENLAVCFLFPAGYGLHEPQIH